MKIPTELKVTAVAGAALIGAFFLGSYTTTFAFGDYILVRSGQMVAGQSMCVAYDPDTGKNAGVWSPDSTDRCRMRDFISARWRNLWTVGAS